MRGILLTVLVVVGLSVVGAAGAVSNPTAQTAVSDAQFQQTNASLVPDSASGFLSELRSLEGVSAYQSYSEFETIRAQAVMDVQIGDFAESDARRFELILRLLWSFDRTVSLQENGSYGAALESAKETSDYVATLQSVDGGERYAALADVALERFYTRTGQELQSRAEELSVTPDRIEALHRASFAYKQAGAVDRYSTVLLRAETLEQSYARDLDALNASAADAESFVSACGQCESPVAALSSYGTDLFPRYQRGLLAGQEVQEAIGLAEQHDLSDRSAELTALQEEVSAARGTLAIASAVLLTGYALVVGLLAAVVGWRLTHWRQDLAAAARGDSVLMGARLDG